SVSNVKLGRGGGAGSGVLGFGGSCWIGKDPLVIIGLLRFSSGKGYLPIEGKGFIGRDLRGGDLGIFRGFRAGIEGSGGGGGGKGLNNEGMEGLVGVLAFGRAGRVSGGAADLGTRLSC
ncbi:hypothetical protein, partial [Moorena sp. SIO2C4]